MKDYIAIGSSPADEPCVQVGSENYYALCREECHRFIKLIREVLGNEPEGARLAVKRFEHDFGPYLEVVCYYDTDNQGAVEYAYRCESESPLTWKP